ncbi:MAG: DUF559 domain-containing protein [Hamadaea sp.]|nr:DUF559 domain-containing protein [Hamadaea sp.]
MEDAVLDSWPIMPTDERIGCVVRAVNEGLTTPARLQATVARVPHIDGRGVVRDLVDRLAAGCRSHLELFGAEVVFVGAGMPEFVRQARIAVRDRVYYLDVFAEREKVDFELDGAAWHGGRHREQDLRRDAALATMGILVVRFSYRRLMTEPQRVRREILCILAERRASISEE